MVPIRCVRRAAAIQRPELLKAIIALEPGGLPTNLSHSDLANLATVPIIVVASEHSAGPLSGYLAIINPLQAAGGNAQLLHLPDVGIFGNSHVMVIEKNNLQIAELVLERAMKIMK
jgi:hypothetical protein